MYNYELAENENVMSECIICIIASKTYYDVINT